MPPPRQSPSPPRKPHILTLRCRRQQSLRSTLHPRALQGQNPSLHNPRTLSPKADRWNRNARAQSTPTWMSNLVWLSQIAHPHLCPPSLCPLKHAKPHRPRLHHHCYHVRLHQHSPGPRDLNMRSQGPRRSGHLYNNPNRSPHSHLRRHLRLQIHCSCHLQEVLLGAIPASFTPTISLSRKLASIHTTSSCVDKKLAFFILRKFALQHCMVRADISKSPSVASITAGVPGALDDSFHSYKDAVTLYSAAFDQGLVHRVVEVRGVYDDEKFVPARPRRPRRSSESSIWDKVTDIDSVAAKWGG
jgi:hypothetical protein